MTLDLINLTNQRELLQKELDSIDEILKDRLEDIQMNSLPDSIYLTVNSNPEFYLVDSLCIRAGEIHCDLVYHRFCLDLDSMPWSKFEMILKELYIKYGLSINIHFKNTLNDIQFRTYCK